MVTRTTQKRHHKPRKHTHKKADPHYYHTHNVMQPRCNQKNDTHAKKRSPNTIRNPRIPILQQQQTPTPHSRLAKIHKPILRRLPQTPNIPRNQTTHQRKHRRRHLPNRTRQTTLHGTPQITPIHPLNPTPNGFTSGASRISTTPTKN